MLIHFLVTYIYTVLHICLLTSENSPLPGHRYRGIGTGASVLGHRYRGIGTGASVPGHRYRCASVPSWASVPGHRYLLAVHGVPGHRMVGV